MKDDTLFDRTGGLGLVLLNRPKALNALTLEMVDALDRQLLAWAEDDAVRAVVVEGAGERAFAAGGDIQRLCEAGRAGDPYTSTFFWDEYILDWRVFHYPKPYVALLDGIVMGGGVGVSVLGSHRVATERTVFAMPETGIGFFPDVGATWFLPRLPGRLGLYLALTGARLGGADSYHAGIATHYVPSARLDELKAALATVPLDGEDIEINHAEVSAVLDRFSENPGPPAIAPVRPALERCFSGASVEGVLEALEAEGGEWADKTRKAMLAKAPTSLKVAFEQYRRGGELDFRCRACAGIPHVAGVHAGPRFLRRRPRPDPRQGQPARLAAGAAFRGDGGGGRRLFLPGGRGTDIRQSRPPICPDMRS